MGKVVKVLTLGLSGAGGKVGKFAQSAALIGAGIATGNIGLISAGISVGASALKSRSPRNSPENANRLRANVDPLTPRKTVIGFTAMPTDIRDEEFTNNQEFFHRFIVCASHKVQSIDEIWFDDEIAWSQAGGVTGKFAGYLALDVCTEGSAAEAINISPRMGATRRYTGLAYVYLRYKLTGNNKKTDSPFAQSIPTRITIRGRGAMLPDPRNPAHNMSDQSTWTWNENASRNPALALLFYLLGWRINGKLAVGKGIPVDRIDLDSFITAANLCDEIVPKPGGGTEPRYRCDGVWSEGDGPTTVIDMLKACMNADLDDVGGKLRLTVFHNDLATPIADYGDNDIIDGFSWQPLPPLDATFNVVRGLYTDSSDTGLYQQVEYPEQREASPDDIDRIETFNLPMVQSPGQAQRLAQLRLQRQQYGGVFEAEFQANAWKVTKNSIIRLTFGQTGFVSKFFRVAEMEIRQDGRVPLKLREEDPAIYGDPPLTGPISPVFSTPFDPANSPYVQAINRWQGQWSPTTTYFLDDLVTAGNGAGWRYINATPTAGQPLPTFPATSNAYWELFTAVPANVAPANANRVPFSRMEGDRGWAVLFNPSGLSAPSDYGEFANRRFFVATPTATAAAQTFSIGGVVPMRITAGERLSVQAKLDVFGAAAAGGSWTFRAIFFDAGGSASFVTIANGTGTVSAAVVTSNFIDVPAEQVSMTLELVAVSGAAGSWLIAISEPMVTSAAEGQTVHPAFSPGPNSDDGADVTAINQRSIEPQFPSIEIKQGEAGHTGNRTVTHAAFRGMVALSGGTWSLPAQNLGAGLATINAGTGTVTLSGIVQSGSYTIRFTDAQGVVTERVVNVAYLPTPPSAIVSAKTGRAVSTVGTPADDNWNSILTLSITGAPTGRVRLGGSEGLSFLQVVSGVDDASYEARLRLNGTTLASVGSQAVLAAGSVLFPSFEGLFLGSYAVTAGTLVFDVELRRTSGSGNITATSTALEATVTAT